MLELHEAEGAFERIEAWLRGQGFFRPAASVSSPTSTSGTASPRRSAGRRRPAPARAVPVAARRLCRPTQGHAGVNHDNSADNDEDDVDAERRGRDRRVAANLGRRPTTPARSTRSVPRSGAATSTRSTSSSTSRRRSPGSPRALAARLAPLTQPNELPFADAALAGVRGPRLGDRHRHARALPRPPRRAGLDAADQGDAAARAARGAPRVGEGRRRARDDRRPRAERPLAHLPAGKRALAGADGARAAGRRRAPRLDGRGRAPAGGRARRRSLAATFPGGSVTGAPKIAAVDLIAALEPVGRGASMGALGRVHGNGDLELALTIRTFAIAEGRIHLWVGGGVVWDSDPDAEVEESLTKAAPLLDAIGAPLDASRSPQRAAGGRRGERRVLGAAISGRGVVDPDDGGRRLRRRGVRARPRGLRDAARLRRQAVPARGSTSSGCAAPRSGSGSPAPDAAALAELAELALEAAGTGTRGRRPPPLLDAGRRVRRAPSAIALVSAIPDVDRGGPRARPAAGLAPVPAALGAVAPAGDEVRELRDAHRGRGGGEAARRGRRRARRPRRDGARGPRDEHVVA